MLLAKQDKTTNRSFKKESLDTYRADKDFQYSLEPIPEDLPKRKEEDAKVANTLQVIMYIIIIAIIAILIYFISKNTVSKSSRKINTDQIPELANQDITEINFDEIIRRTVEAGDHRKAVRLLYLETLKTLTTNGWINWKVHKTNYDYQLELAKTKFNDSFDKLTYSFEYIWYGNLSIDEERYMAVEKVFKDFQSRVSAIK